MPYLSALFDKVNSSSIISTTGLVATVDFLIAHLISINISMGFEKSHANPMDVTFGQLILFMGASTSTTQASALTSESTSNSQSLAVSSVNGNTIVAKSANGSSVTIHTIASTRFTQARNSVAASTVKVGARIHVMGTHNSDGSLLPHVLI